MENEQLRVKNAEAGLTFILPEDEVLTLYKTVGNAIRLRGKFYRYCHIESRGSKLE